MSAITFSMLNAMSEQELRDLNARIVTIIKERMRITQMEKASEFRVGQRVSFPDKDGMTRLLRITRINTKSVSGFEIDPVTGVEGHRQWRVAPSLLSAA